MSKSTVSIDELRALLEQGCSYRVIAQQLEVSRSAVSGMVARHLRDRPAVKTTQCLRGQSRPKFKPKEMEEEPVSKKVQMVDLGRLDCRYPSGEGANITFCGHPVTFGPYCPYHSGIVWQKRQPKVAINDDLGAVQRLPIVRAVI